MKRSRILKALSYAGILILVMGGLFAFRSHHHPAEKRLVLVEGVPRDVVIRDMSGASQILFTVGGRKFDYTSDRPNFRSVVSVIEDGEWIRVWGKPIRRKHFFLPPHDDFDVYKISIGDTAIVTYDDTVSRDTEQYFYALVFIASIYAFIGVFALWPSLFRRRKPETEIATDASNRVLEMLKAAEHGRPAEPTESASQRLNPPALNRDAPAEPS